MGILYVSVGIKYEPAWRIVAHSKLSLLLLVAEAHVQKLSKAQFAVGASVSVSTSWSATICHPS